MTTLSSTSVKTNPVQMIPISEILKNFETIDEEPELVLPPKSVAASNKQVRMVTSKFPENDMSPPQKQTWEDE